MQPLHSYMAPSIRIPMLVIRMFVPTSWQCQADHIWLADRGSSMQCFGSALEALIATFSRMTPAQYTLHCLTGHDLKRAILLAGATCPGGDPYSSM